MPYANLQIGMTEAQQQDYVDRINQLQADMDFLIQLTSKERVKGLRMGTKAPAFIQKGQQLLPQNTHLLPTYYNVAAFEQDAQDYTHLMGIRTQARKLLSGLDDTIRALEQECVATLLDFYKHAQSASRQNVKGASTAVEQLRPFMHRGK